MEQNYVALAYYLFVSLEDPHREVEKHKAFFEGRDCTARIYISEEGINGQMSASIDDAEAYMVWLRSDERFAAVQFKLDPVNQQIFPRLTVKYRKQLVALDQKLDVSKGAEHVSPEKWKEMLEEGGYLLLDVRNQYEWAIGHFEGATLPALETFREFPRYAEKLAEEVDPAQTKVMMYCTGGIRCELYSVIMQQQGFDKVYQLDGGVINYGHAVGSTHWKGKLFVFDDRLAVNIDGQEASPIAQCRHCHLAEDTYYNCANMDCNELFICCLSCHELYKGCCCHGCTSSSHLRPYDPAAKNRPFRRKHLLAHACCAPSVKCAAVSVSG